VYETVVLRHLPLTAHFAMAETKPKYVNSLLELGGKPYDGSFAANGQPFSR